MFEIDIQMLYQLLKRHRQFAMRPLMVNLEDH